MRGRRISGFSLIELLVTIAIIAILAALAFPSFESTIRANRVSTMTNELLASLSLARTEAIRSTQRAVICASENGTSCGADWNQGWIVFVDTNKSGTVNGTESVVRYVQAHSNMTLAVTASGGLSTTAVNFDNRGRPDAGGERTMTLRPSVCPSGQKLMRAMKITTVGQVNTTSSDC